MLMTTTNGRRDAICSFTPTKGHRMDSTEGINGNGNATRDKLMRDLKIVIDDAEELLKNSGQQTSDGFNDAKAKFENTLQNAKGQLCELEASLAAKAKDAVRATDNYVSDNPWQAIGVAGVLGLITGLLIGRK
jgi:ElaB/YqjD/DUF883 family membrane-anchored ribosome-binding protein